MQIYVFKSLVGCTALSAMLMLGSCSQAGDNTASA